MAEQLSFDLPARTALDRKDFYVSPANALAVATISAPRWPDGKLVLTGPAGSGKTHLAHVWAAETGGRIVGAATLCEKAVPDLAAGPVAVEDVPGIAGDDDRQRALFHLHNLVLAEGHALLLTGRGTPKSWALPLADLQSRIEGTHLVALDPPDDTLLGAVLAKLFDDRQLSPGPEVIQYLVRHLDRDFDSAARMVDRLDRAALAQRRPITRALAVAEIKKTASPQETGDFSKKPGYSAP